MEEERFNSECFDITISKVGKAKRAKEIKDRVKKSIEKRGNLFGIGITYSHWKQGDYSGRTNIGTETVFN